METKNCKICGIEFDELSKDSIEHLYDRFDREIEYKAWNIGVLGDYRFGHRPDRVYYEWFYENFKKNKIVHCGFDPVLKCFCPAHLEDFFRFGIRRQRLIINRKGSEWWEPTRDQIIEYTQQKVKNVVKQIKDEKPAGFCDVIKKSNGLRCEHFACDMIDGNKVCGGHKMHINRGRHLNFISGRQVQDLSPVVKAAKNLLGVE